MPRLLLLLLLTLVLTFPFGCRRPSQANIELRKEKQALQQSIARLEAENEQLRSDIRRLESNVTTVPTLPQERLEALFTVAGLEYGRLTGIDRRADGQPLKVYLKPVDSRGDTLKAAGAITVEAFDLEREDVRLGQWSFPLAEAKQYWNSGGLLNEYVLTLPWEGEAPAPDSQILVNTTFVDGLTGRTFEARTDVE